MYCLQSVGFSLLILLLPWMDFFNNIITTATNKNGLKRISRRNLYSQHHRHHYIRNVQQPLRGRPSSEVGINKANKNNLSPLRFIMKCPQITKNVSAVLWSLNGTELFGISFASNDDDQTLVDVTNESADDSLEGKQQWHTKDGAVALIFTAKRGRLRFEVETGGKMRKSCFVLRINEVNVREDSGEWRCRVLVVDGNGGVRAEAESRKSIGGDQWEKSAEMRVSSNGRQMWKREHHQQRNWRRGSSTGGGGDVSSLFSFSFTKTDTDFVVFERTETPDSAAVHGGTRLSQSLDRGEGIAYSRVDSVHQSDEVNNLDDIWLMRWNSALRRKSNRSSKPNCQNDFLITLFIIVLMLCQLFVNIHPI